MRLRSVWLVSVQNCLTLRLSLSISLKLFLCQGENGAHSALMAEHQPEAAAATESSMAIQNKINQDVDENERTLASALIKKENEIQTLRETLEKLNLYLGDELVVGSSGESDVEDNISAPSVLNTRHYQLDSLFAPKYYFIMNVSLQ